MVFKSCFKHRLKWLNEKEAKTKRPRNERKKPDRIINRLSVTSIIMNIESEESAKCWTPLTSYLLVRLRFWFYRHTLRSFYRWRPINGTGNFLLEWLWLFRDEYLRIDVRAETFLLANRKRAVFEILVKMKQLFFSLSILLMTCADGNGSILSWWWSKIKSMGLFCVNWCDVTSFGDNRGLIGK